MSSITRLATVTDIGDPIAVPNVCLKNVLSTLRRCLATSMAFFVGIVVKSETTSKDTNTVPHGIHCVEMNLAKSNEFFT